MARGMLCEDLLEQLLAVILPAVLQHSALHVRVVRSLARGSGLANSLQNSVIAFCVLQTCPVCRRLDLAPASARSHCAAVPTPGHWRRLLERLRRPASIAACVRVAAPPAGGAQSVSMSALPVTSSGKPGDQEEHQADDQVQAERRQIARRACPRRTRASGTPGFDSRYHSVRHRRESACVMLSKASPAKWPRVCTCGSWRCPQAAQYSPASGAPQLAHTSVCGAGELRRTNYRDRAVGSSCVQATWPGGTE